LSLEGWKLATSLVLALAGGGGLATAALGGGAASKEEVAEIRDQMLEVKAELIGLKAQGSIQSERYDSIRTSLSELKEALEVGRRLAGGNFTRTDHDKFAADLAASLRRRQEREDARFEVVEERLRKHQSLRAHPEAAARITQVERRLDKLEEKERNR